MSPLGSSLDARPGLVPVGITEHSSGPESVDTSVLVGLDQLGLPEDKDFVRNLLRMYLAGTGATIAALRAAAAPADSAELKRLAHALTGSSSSLGAIALADLCRSLERAVSSGEMALVPPCVEAVARESERVNRRFEEEVRRRAVPQPVL